MLEIEQQIDGVLILLPTPYQSPQHLFVASLTINVNISLHIWNLWPKILLLTSSIGTMLLSRFVATFRRLSIVIYAMPLNYIQVEDRLFCVPRYEFVQSSEVFADMFLLPSGPGANTEGRDREHPIVLEGYKKDEFACLLKVMYPTYVPITFIQLDLMYLSGCRASSLVSGTTLDLCLGKEEWVSVVKISTIWNMEKVCRNSPETLFRWLSRLMHDIHLPDQEVRYSQVVDRFRFISHREDSSC